MQGVRVGRDSRLEPLGKALEQFIVNLDTYARTCEWGDLPHYYNERATLSVFAAACWQVELIAVEEYATTKTCGQGRKNGRCDLWVSNHDVSWGFEAKQFFPALNGGEPRIASCIASAATAAKMNDDADLHVGLTFLTPSVPTDTAREDVLKLLRRMLDLPIMSRCHGVAWWFPEELMQHAGPLRANPSVAHLWPGLLAVLQVVRPDGLAEIGQIWTGGSRANEAPMTGPSPSVSGAVNMQAVEAAARALCRHAGNPENTKFEGNPMWQSYIPEATLALTAALPFFRDT